MTMAHAIPKAQFFRHHLLWYKTLRPIPFLLAITLEGLVASILVAWILRHLHPATGNARPDLAGPPADVFFAICLSAPIVETLLYQFLPIVLLRICRARGWVQMAISTALFTWAHTGIGPDIAISAGLVGGFYFAFTFAHWRTARGLVMAPALTAGSHALHNFILFVLLFFSGGFDAPAFARIDTPEFQAIYVTGTHHEYLFTLAADHIDGVFNPAGDKLYSSVGPLRVIVSSGKNSWSHSISFGGDTLTINAAAFHLDQGAVFYLRDGHFGDAVTQHKLAMDARVFSADPAAAIRRQLKNLATATQPEF